MGGLNHEFWLVRRSEHDYSDYMSDPENATVVAIHDDFIQYINDTLVWIPSFNPAKSEAAKGLMRHGPTVIREDGAEKAEIVFARWAALFEAGPSRLKLTITGCEVLETFEVDREEITAKLRELAAWCRQVASSSGELYVRHSGV